MAENRKWAGTTYGNDWMHSALIFVLRYMNVRLLYLFAYIFIVPPCLLFNHSYKPIYRYFHKRFGFSPCRSFLKTYVNHCLFSQMVIDKFAMYAGKKFDVNIVSHDYFLNLSKGEEGFIQLSSHIGNYDIAGYSLVAKYKPINVLVFGDEKASIIENRAKMFEKKNIHMILIKSDMSHLFAINAALNNKEIVSMSADRIVGSQKSIILNFLGAPATFPMGPFAIATMQKLDVIAIDVMKTKPRQYTVYISPIAYDKTSSRMEQIQQLATNYVKELERKVRTYQTQWFNFFEFWN